jgi:nucleotide-binding universal stress UspA family protein
MTEDAANPVAAAPDSFVVPLDGSDFAMRALPVVAGYAARLDADVVLVTAPTSLDGGADERTPAWLDDIARSLDGAMAVETVVSNAPDPVETIRAETGARRNPAVCMATHGRGAVGSATLGSVAARLVREVPAPLLLVGRRATTTSPPQGPIVVCHDGSTAADAIVAPARAWAEALDVAIEVVEVLHPLDVSVATSPQGDVERVAAQLGPRAHISVLRSSDPPAEICNFAADVGAGLVAMSTHGRTGLARVLGSVTMDVVRHCTCPVLVHRPAALLDNQPENTRAEEARTS